jgi:hypothetical protein
MKGASMMKLVAYIQADLDSSVAEDPMLPEVAWDWLTEELDALEGTRLQRTWAAR